jgi:hypothetical protein
MSCSRCVLKLIVDQRFRRITLDLVIAATIVFSARVSDLFQAGRMMEPKCRLHHRKVRVTLKIS